MVKAYVWVVLGMYVLVFMANVVAGSTTGTRYQVNVGQMFGAAIMLVWGILVLLQLYGRLV